MLGTMGAGGNTLGDAGIATPAKAGRAGMGRSEGESCGHAGLCCNRMSMRMAVHRM